VNIYRRQFGWLVGMCALAVPASAFAYLDPGTGSMILQGIIAALAGAAVTLKLYWYRIRSLFFRRRKDKVEVDTTDTTKGHGGNR